MLGDFNAEDTGPSLSKFLEQYAAKNIMKEKTCFHNLNRSTGINLLSKIKLMSKINLSELMRYLI